MRCGHLPDMATSRVPDRQDFRARLCPRTGAYQLRMLVLSPDNDHLPGTPRSGRRAETRQVGPRPPGSKNRRPATRQDVGKAVMQEQSNKKTRRQAEGSNNKLRVRRFSLPGLRGVPGGAWSSVGGEEDV